MKYYPEGLIKGHHFECRCNRCTEVNNLEIYLKTHKNHSKLTDKK